MGAIVSILLAALPEILGAIKKGTQQSQPLAPTVNWSGVVLAILKDPQAMAALELLFGAIAGHVHAQTALPTRLDGGTPTTVIEPERPSQPFVPHQR